MMYQVPVDLIERARILLRNEADLESYNLSDPSFPSLPSVEEVISGFDPSPACTRCEHCRGNLMRGSQSLICLYCGREPKRDCPPEPLSLKSTLGFRWLLDSLGLDGSEIIEAPEEGKQSNKGWKPVRDEMTLSEFLNKEIKWAVESERFGLCAADDLRNHGKAILQLAGIDFNHSLQEEVDNFSNLPIVEAISNSRSIDVKPKAGDTFSGWEADFQAASYVAPLLHDNESSQTSKLSADDYSSHMDSVLGPQKDFEEIETDYRSNIFSGVSSSTVVSSSSKLPGNNDSGDNKQRKSTIDDHKESNSLETWSDFRSSGFPSGGQLANSGLDSAKKMFIGAGNELFGPWNEVPNLKYSEQGQQEVPDKLAVSLDTANQMSELDDNLQQTGTLLTADKRSEKDEYLSTMWDDFMGSSVSQHNPGESGIVEFVGGWLNDEGGGTTDTWGNFMSLSSSRREKETNSTETHDGMEVIKDEAFGSLSNLTSSTSRPEIKSGNEDMTHAWNDISNSTLGVPKTDTAKDEVMFNSWGDFSSTSVFPQQQNNDALSEDHRLFNEWNSRTSDSKGTSEYQLKVDEDSVPASITETSEIDDSFDAWSEFTSSTALPSSSFENSKESQLNGKQDLAGHDPFDAWSLLMTSSSRTSNQNVTSVEPSIETSLFDSSENQKAPEFTANGSGSCTGISSSQVLDHFRMNDGGTKSSTSQNDEPQASGQMSWKKPIDVEALMSQMHDLSFMLESNLSVPEM